MAIDKYSLLIIDACIAWLSRNLKSIPASDLKGLFRIQGGRDIVNNIRKQIDAATELAYPKATSTTTATSAATSVTLPSKEFIINAMKKVRETYPSTFDADFAHSTATLISNILTLFDPPLIPFDFLAADHEIPEGYEIIVKGSGANVNSEIVQIADKGSSTTLEATRSASAVKLGESLVLRLVAAHITLGDDMIQTIIETVSALFSLFKSITDIPELSMNAINLFTSVPALYLSKDPTKLMSESATLKAIQNAAKKDMARSTISTFEALVVAGRRVHGMVEDLLKTKGMHSDSELLDMIQNISKMAKPMPSKKDRVKSIFFPFINAEKEQQKQIDIMQKNIGEMAKDEDNKALSTLRGLKSVRSINAFSKDDLIASRQPQGSVAAPSGLGSASVANPYQAAKSTTGAVSSPSLAAASSTSAKPSPSLAAAASSSGGVKPSPVQGLARQRSDGSSPGTKGRIVYRAIHSFTRRTDPELSFTEGETFLLKKNYGDGWAKVQRRGGQSEVGIVPMNYIEEVLGEAIEQLSLSISSSGTFQSISLAGNGASHQQRPSPPAIPPAFRRQLSVDDVASLAMSGKQILVSTAASGVPASPNRQ